ncbi:Methanesulfonate monooxygenase component iron sulfur protein (fragment) [Stutzerimonas xanthomarina]
MSKQPVCKKNDVSEGQMRTFDVNGQQVLILNSAGNLYACRGICPHQEVALEEGMFDGEILTCHSHLWQWDIKTGHALGLAEAPLQTYQITEEDGEILVEI